MLFATYRGTILSIVPATGPATEGTLDVQLVMTGGTGWFTGSTGSPAGTGSQVFHDVVTATYGGWMAY